MIVKGRDSWGPWHLEIFSTERRPSVLCELCHLPVHAVLSYQQLHLPADIPVDKTILGRVRQPIGVDCGCWSKFTRQVVHITESALRKGYAV